MLLQQFQQNLKENFSQLIPGHRKLLLAVSGGIDSVVLTHLFYASAFDFIILHCNFQLREEESIRDELFVRSFKHKFGKEVLVKRFNTQDYAATNKISIQEAARELRYDWFKSVNRKQSTVNSQSFIVTAHNADDNIETMLMFLFRGTGIHGLTGINAFDRERNIIRPLLFASRKQIEDYAEANKLEWVEDSSNAADKYTRNFFRHNVIPLVEKQYPNAKQNLLNGITRFKDVEALYAHAIEIHKKRLLETKGGEVHIPLLKLQQTKPLQTIIWEIIKAYNFQPQQVDEVKKLFAADNSSYIKSATHRIIKNRKWLVIAPLNNEAAQNILIEENDSEVKFQNGVLHIEKLETENYKLQTTNLVAQLNTRHLVFPLLLRKWKQGDYFYPLGMNKKKKLSRFFIDEKLSATAKENIWVIEMDKKITWIIGYRIDERFKITASTKEILKINFIAEQKH